MSNEIYNIEETTTSETFFLEIDDQDEDYEIDENDKLPDTLKMYYLEVSKYPLLSASEEKELGMTLKKVQDCILLDKDSSIKNKLDYNLVGINFMIYQDNLEVIELMKEIIKFNRNEDPRKTEISDILHLRINTSITESSKILKLDEFIDNLKLYLNYLIAKEKMINSNLRLVISFAKRYSNYKVNLIDLISEGNIGLIAATDNYDVDKGFRFSTYATWWIKQFVIRHLYLNSIDISITENKLRAALKLRKKVEELELKTGKRYSYHELATILNLDYQKIVEYMSINPSISLETPLANDDNEMVLKDILFIEKDFTEKNVFSNNLKKDIECLFENLTDREKQVVALRFGFNSTEDKTYTLEAIGKMYNVTKERIRAIEAKALKKMRENVERNPKAKQLKAYLTN